MSKERRSFLTDLSARTIPMTGSTICFLEQNRIQDKNPNVFVLTGTTQMIESRRRLESSSQKLLSPAIENKFLKAECLRSTFILQCIKVNLNIETISALTGVDKTFLYHNYGRYIKAKPEDISRLNEATQRQNPIAPRHLNLLILGSAVMTTALEKLLKCLAFLMELNFWMTVPGAEVS